MAAAAVIAGTLMMRYLGEVDVVVASASHFLFGGLVLALAAAFVEGAPNIDWTLRFVSVLAFVGLVVGVAVLGERPNLLTLAGIVVVLAACGLP